MIWVTFITCIMLFFVAKIEYMAKKATGDRRKRSFVKAMTFRMVIIIADSIIGWLLTHRLDLTAGFVVFTNLASTLIYYLHERLWSQVEWGRRK